MSRHTAKQTYGEWCAYDLQSGTLGFSAYNGSYWWVYSRNYRLHTWLGMVIKIDGLFYPVSLLRWRNSGSLSRWPSHERDECAERLRREVMRELDEEKR